MLTAHHVTQLAGLVCLVAIVASTGTGEAKKKAPLYTDPAGWVINTDNPAENLMVKYYSWKFDAPLKFQEMMAKGVYRGYVYCDETGVKNWWCFTVDPNGLTLVWYTRSRIIITAKVDGEVKEFASTEFFFTKERQKYMKFPLVAIRNNDGWDATSNGIVVTAKFDFGKKYPKEVLSVRVADVDIGESLSSR